jgi:hypothetical protein
MNAYVFQPGCPTYLQSADEGMSALMVAIGAEPNTYSEDCLWWVVFVLFLTLKFIYLKNSFIQKI